MVDQEAKPTFRSRYAHTQFKEQSEGPIDIVASKFMESRLNPYKPGVPFLGQRQTVQCQIRRRRTRPSTPYI